MKKLLILLAIVIFLATGAQATPKHYPNELSNVNDSLSLTVTIDLGNLSRLTKSDIDAKIKAMTTDFFLKEAKSYTVTIKASKSLKNLTNDKVKFEDLKLKAQIKGTYTEVKKELSNIADVFIKLKSE